MWIVEATAAELAFEGHCKHSVLVDAAASYSQFPIVQEHMCLALTLFATVASFSATQSVCPRCTQVRHYLILSLDTVILAHLRPGI